MQSGRAATRTWILEFAPGAAKRPDDLMGWSGSNDTRSQIKLKFASQELAEDYAKRHGIAYRVLPVAMPRPVFKSYADNFK